MDAETCPTEGRHKPPLGLSFLTAKKRGDCMAWLDSNPRSFFKPIKCYVLKGFQEMDEKAGKDSLDEAQWILKYTQVMRKQVLMRLI